MAYIESQPKCSDHANLPHDMDGWMHNYNCSIICNTSNRKKSKGSLDPSYAAKCLYSYLWVIGLGTSPEGMSLIVGQAC